jgi:glycosyltransferase involved in cell wall biosynthesis
MIAVLIPTFQPDEYLLECFNSLEAQTLPKNRFRVYICLNGPLAQYEHRVRQYLNNVDFEYDLQCTTTQGVSHARNLLLDKSTEEFVTFVDDDDLVSPNFLEELCEVASRDGVGISNVIDWRPELNTYQKNFIGKTFDNIRDTETSKLRARKYFSAPWAKVISRSTIGKTRFQEDLELGEDALFMAMISKDVKYIRKTDTTAQYIVRIRSGSVTRKLRGKIYEIVRCIDMLKRYFSLVRKREYDQIFITSRLLATVKNLFLRLLL